MIESRLYEATAPVELGGDEISLPELVRVEEELGYADPSVAWCVGNSWTAGAAASRIQSPARERLFGGPTKLTGFGLAPGGRVSVTSDGLRLKGQWPVVSGCQVAGRFALASIFMDGDQPRLVGGRPDVRFVVVEPAVVDILDTWSDVQALRGSGSHAVRVQDALVDEDCAFSFTDPPLFDRPAFRVGLMVGAHIGASAILVGAARAALDGLVAQASSRVSAASGQAWRDWPNIQDIVATSAAKLMSSLAGLIRAAEQAWASLQDAQEIPPVERGMIYAMCDHAHRTAREAVSRLFTAGSIDGLHHGHILQQSLRDVHALSVNWERYGQLRYDAGRVMLGLPSLHPLY